MFAGFKPDGKTVHKITSTSNPKFRNACRLHSSRGRRAQGKIIIFGCREVFRCLRLHSVDELFVAPDQISPGDLQLVEEAVRNQDCPAYELPGELLDKLNYGARSDGVVAVAKRPLTELDRLKPANASTYS